MENGGEVDGSCRQGSWTSPHRSQWVYNGRVAEIASMGKYDGTHGSTTSTDQFLGPLNIEPRERWMGRKNGLDKQTEIGPIKFKLNKRQRVIHVTTPRILQYTAPYSQFLSPCR
jgi:hypothetical protein